MGAGGGSCGSRGWVVTGREQVVEAVRQRRFDDLARMVAADRRTIRYLVGLTYQADPGLRGAAARGLALAARDHPRMIAEVVRRLVWAMNEESGTNAPFAPEVLRAVAEERPEVLVPFLPDLMRLTGDPGLRDALVGVAQRVAEGRRSEAARRVQDGLRSCGREDQRGSR